MSGGRSPINTEGRHDLKLSRTPTAWLAAVAAAVLASTGGPPALAAGAGPTTSPGPTGATPTPPGAHRITLITGDVVTTRQTPNGGTVEVRRPDGTPSQVRVVESGTELFVYPQPVLPYVAAHTLDKGLFNVTRLIADGYDDTKMDQLPLIVSYADPTAGLRAGAAPTGATRTRALSSINGAALAEHRDQAGRFWDGITGTTPTAESSASTARTTGPGRFSGGIAKIWLDGRVHADLADTTAQIGAPEVWAGGDTGAGVRVGGAGHRYRHDPPGPDRPDRPSRPCSYPARRSPTGPDTALTSPPPSPVPAPPPAAGRRASPRPPDSPSARCSATTAPAWTPGSSPGWSGRPGSRTPRSST